MELYLVLLDTQTMKQFKRYFKSEYEMDKFIHKLSYSKKLYIVRYSRESYIIGFGRTSRL